MDNVFPNKAVYLSKRRHMGYLSKRQAYGVCCCGIKLYPNRTIAPVD